MADYMMLPDDDERVFPTDRQVVDVMDAAGGAEAEVVECLRYLYNERGLRPGTKYGPHHFSWFKTVVADYFQQRRQRDLITNPERPAWESGAPAGLSTAEFDSMTGVIEIDGA